MIVVDEEHDTSYKQEEGVRYHGRDLAVVRGRIVGCPVILGSATPSVESYHNARSGRYRLLELTERVEARPMPRVEIVDLKTRPGQSTADGLFSAPLVSALRENHERGRQSLNLPQPAGVRVVPLQCWSCGFVFRCPRCSISLTYHLGRDSTFCHHCGFRQPQGGRLPRMRQPFPERGRLRHGEGRARVATRFCPRPVSAAWTGTTTSARGAQERIFRAWEKGDLDVLVGNPDGRQGT